METRNYKLIRDFLSFKDADEFYFAQIIQRKKENPDITRSNKVIKTYYIDSFEKYDDLQEEIIGLCNLFNARAYINLNKRLYSKCAFLLLKEVSDHIVSNDYKHIKGCYDSVCGRFLPTDKTWVIDIDYTDKGEWLLDRTYDLKVLINELRPSGFKVLLEVPTKNGIHLITKPFDVKLLSEMSPLVYKGIDIHKNNPTLLHWADDI